MKFVLHIRLIKNSKHLIYKPTELRSLTDLESLTGKKKFMELAAGLIEKPPGKPTLVTEQDKRPEWVPEQDLIALF